jgi:hypothetical protein
MGSVVRYESAATSASAVLWLMGGSGGDYKGGDFHYALFG